MVDILLGLVFVFIICTTPHLVLDIYQWLSSLISNDYNDSYTGLRAAVVQLVNLLLSASHALNIFVFCCQVLTFIRPSLVYVFIGPRCPWSDLWVRLSLTH